MAPDFEPGIKRDDPLRQKLEDAIYRGDRSLVRNLVREFLATSAKGATTRFEASDYYRRMDDTSLAIRVLGAEREFRSWEKLEPAQITAQLQLARLFNAAGASSYALRIVERVPAPLRLRNAQVVGGIMLSNYRYPEAMACYERACAEVGGEPSPKNLYPSILLARCLYALNFKREAEKQLRIVLKRSPDRRIRGLCHQTLASGHVMASEYAAAEAELDRMKAELKGFGASVDLGNGLKWEGALHCLAGNWAVAEDCLQRAWSMLFLKGEKPEAWLEVYYWMGLVELRRNPASTFPQAWARILGYPGPGVRVINWIHQNSVVPETLDFSFAGPGKWVEWLEWRDLSADCAYRQHGRRASYVGHRVGLDLVDRLSAILAVAGEAGVPQFRIFEALWLNDLFSFSQHQKRLEQVLVRARRRGLEIRSEKLHLQLLRSPTPLCVRWSARTHPRGAPFFETIQGAFRRKDVESFFGLSARSAAYLCAEWLRDGVIRESGGGGAARGYELRWAGNGVGGGVDG